MVRGGVILVASVALMGAWAAVQAPARAQPAPRGESAKLKAAREAYEWVVKLPEEGFDPETRYTWSRRWMEAEREAAPAGPGRRAAAEAHLARVKPMLDVAVRRQKGGFASAREVAAVKYFVAEAEQWAAEAK